MGFCLVNNVAIAAAALAARGERVVIVDYDAHHGNGTQDCFYRDPRVMYVSFHEYPLYPGTGALSEVGEGEGRGTTINFPFPAGTTGDSYRAAIDDCSRGRDHRFRPTWLIVSAGFDGHRRGPADRARAERRRLCGHHCDRLSGRAAGPSPGVPRGRIRPPGPRRLDRGLLSVLEGIEHHPERPTSGGPGAPVVSASSGSGPRSRQTHATEVNVSRRDARRPIPL